jgi:hypothetical protein
MRVLPQLIKAERFRIDTGSSAIYVEHLNQSPSSSINALTPWADKPISKTYAKILESH